MSSTHQASAIRLRLLFVALGLAGPVLPAAALTEDELRYQTVGMRLTAEEAEALGAGLAEAPDELGAWVLRAFQRCWGEGARGFGSTTIVLSNSRSICSCNSIGSETNASRPGSHW